MTLIFILLLFICVFLHLWGSRWWWTACEYLWVVWG